MAHTLDLFPKVTAIAFTTGPGGYVGLNVGYTDEGMPANVGELQEPVEISDMYHVELWARSEETGFQLFEGRVMTVNQDQGVAVTALQAVGYGVQDGAVNDSYFDSMDIRMLSAGDILREAVPTITPILQIGGRDLFVDPGVGTKMSPSGLQGQTAGQIVDQVVKTGTDNAQQQIYECYGRTINIRPRVPPPGGPEYVVQPTEVKWVRDSTHLYGSVSVEFQPKGGTKGRTIPAVYNTFPGRYRGLVRSLLVPNSEIDEVQAELLARRLLDIYKNPVITGTFELTESNPMYTTQGGVVPYWKPRYSEWCQVGTRPPLMIVGTSVNLTTRTSTITLSNAL
jgi:hypothetical protein